MKRWWTEYGRPVALAFAIPAMYVALQACTESSAQTADKATGVMTEVTAVVSDKIWTDTGGPTVWLADGDKVTAYHLDAPNDVLLYGYARTGERIEATIVQPDEGLPVIAEINGAVKEYEEQQKKEAEKQDQESGSDK